MGVEVHYPRPDESVLIDASQCHGSEKVMASEYHRRHTVFTTSFLPIINTLRNYRPSFYRAVPAVSVVGLYLSGVLVATGFPCLKKEDPSHISHPSLPQATGRVSSTLSAQFVPDYQTSLNVPVMRADFLDLAIANTLVRFHFDKFWSLEP